MSQIQQIRTALAAESLPPPSQAWLQSIIASQNTASGRPSPLPTLVATVKARLLASDLATPGVLDPAAASRLTLPAEYISGGPLATAQASPLAHDVVVQVLDLENLAQSRWQQIQDLEAIERGEQKRGREIVRLPVGGGGDYDDENESVDDAPPTRHPAESSATADAHTTASTNATHRLVLQDARGQTLFGLEVGRIPRFGIGRLSIGEKLLVKAGTIVARGVLLLEPANVRLLGGKIEAMHKAWVDGRLARLRDSVQAAT